jgi:hypothetical protein
MNNRRAEPIAGTPLAELPHTLPMGAPFKERFGIGRSTQAALIQRSEIESALVGDKRGRRVIFTQSYLDYLARQQEKEAAGKIGGPSPNPRARARQPSLPTKEATPARGIADAAPNRRRGARSGDRAG